MLTRVPVCLCLVWLMTALSSHAQLYWDTDGTSVNGLQPGAGTWSTSDAVWSSAVGGSSPLVPWTNGSAANFQTGGTNTVTMGSGVIVSTLTQTGAGTVTTLSGSDSLQINTGVTNSGNQLLTVANITLNNASGVTFNAATGANIAVAGTIAELAAGSDVVKSGSGTLTLGGVGSYTGETRITAGVLAISHEQALGTTVVGTSISAGATLQLDGGATGLTVTGETLSITGTSDATYIQSNGASTNVWTGDLTLNVSSNVRFNVGTNNTLRITGDIATTGSGLFVLQGTGNGEFTGNLTGTANLRLGNNASGVWTLSGNNTFTGQTVVSNGTLSVASIATNLGSPTGGNSIIGLGGTGFTGKLRHTGAAESTSRILSIMGTNSGNGGELQATGSGALTWQGDVRVVSGTDAAQARAFILNAGNAFENLFSGKITNTTDGTAIAVGTLGVTKTGTGTWVLSGSNSYKGVTTVSTGILIIENATALGTVDGATSVTSGAALRLRGGITVSGEALTLNGAGTNGRGALVNESGNNVWNGALTVNTPATHTRIGVEAGSMILQGTINLNGATGSMVLHGTGGTIESAISGSGGIIRSNNDSGTWTLTGNNTYTGDTTVSRGTLLVNNTTGSGTGSGNVNVTSAASTSILGGTGTIVPGAGKKVTIDTNGSLRPGNDTGDTTGTLTINGELVFTAAAGVTAQFQIAGKNAGDYDQVIVTNGPVTLDGTITVAFTGGFTAANVSWGDEWKLFDWGAIVPNHDGFDASSNSELVLPTLSGGLVWDRTLFETDGIIRAVPEPGRGVLLLLACAGFLMRRRRF